MTTNTAFAIAVVFKWLAACAITGGAGFLMYVGKEGWGWLVFLAMLVICVEYKTGNVKDKE